MQQALRGELMVARGNDAEKVHLRTHVHHPAKQVLLPQQFREQHGSEVVGLKCVVEAILGEATWLVLPTPRDSSVVDQNDFWRLIVSQNSFNTLVPSTSAL